MFVSTLQLWPPQIREKFLASQLQVQAKEATREQSRLEQLNTLQEHVGSLQEEVRNDFEKGRSELYIIKAVLDSNKTEIHKEMNDVKEVVTELFELLSA